MSACFGAEEFVRGGGISFFDLKNGTNYTPILPCSRRGLRWLLADRASLLARAKAAWALFLRRRAPKKRVGVFSGFRSLPSRAN